MTKCPFCGSDLPVHAKFCGRCGRMLGTASSSEMVMWNSSPEQGRGSQVAVSNPPSLPPANSVPMAPYTPSPPEQPWMRTPAGIAVIALIVVTIITGTSAAIYAYYVQSQPKPTLTVNSAYKSGAIPAGTNGMALQVSGEGFSRSSAITFLLDDNPISDAAPVQSDGDGKIRSNLTISNSWKEGRHTLTAKDAGGYTTAQGIPVVVVLPGQAHTPGPKGSPSDDASFKLKVTYTTPPLLIGKPTITEAILTITGRPDPEGGAVCDQSVDDKPRVKTGEFTNNGGKYNETFFVTCQGNYKGGKITYNEIRTKDTIVFQDKNETITCSAVNYRQLIMEGTFSNQDTISGTFRDPGQKLDCDKAGASTWHNPERGTWTGKIIS